MEYLGMKAYYNVRRVNLNFFAATQVGGLRN